MSQNSSPYYSISIVQAIQLGIGILFLYAGVHKLGAFNTFSRGVREYQILSDGLSVIVAPLLVAAELFIAISHLTGWWLMKTIPLSAFLMMLFGYAISINLARHRALPCYCFGSDNDKVLSVGSLVPLTVIILSEAILYLVLLRQPKYAFLILSASLDDAIVSLGYGALLLQVAMWLLSAATLKTLFLPQWRALTTGHRHR